MLNDNFRSTLAFGAAIYMSRAFFQLPQPVKYEALQRIAAYRQFHGDGEHDAGVIILKSHAVLWRIEYRTPDLKGTSKDPSDPEQTVRVLIVELDEPEAVGQ